MCFYFYCFFSCLPSFFSAAIIIIRVKLREVEYLRLWSGACHIYDWLSLFIFYLGLVCCAYISSRTTDKRNWNWREYEILKFWKRKSGWNGRIVMEGGKDSVLCLFEIEIIIKIIGDWRNWWIVVLVIFMLCVVSFCSF